MKILNVLQRPTVLSLALSIAVLGSAVLAPAHGQAPDPVGHEFQVNTYTTGYQMFPTITEAGGNFVVVWRSDGSANDPDYGITGRRLAEDGTPLGGEIQINSFTDDLQFEPFVAAAANGDFIVSWNGASPGTDTSGPSVQARRFASDGTPRGDDFQVNVYTTDSQRRTSAGAAANGDFVIVWQSFGSAGTDSDGYSIQARRFASSGAPLGGEFQVNTDTSGRQYAPSVAVDPDGDFTVVWEGAPGIRGQRFSSAGATVGGEFTVLPTGIGAPKIFNLEGDDLVLWANSDSVGDDLDVSVQARRITSDGTPIGEQFQVNTYTSGPQTEAVATSTPDGGFVVSWTSYGPPSPGGGYGIRGQAFASDGSFVGDEFQINTYTTGPQVTSAIASNAGRLVVVWGNYGSVGNDDSGFSVQARPFAIDLFSDGFESGDASAWSATVP